LRPVVKPFHILLAIIAILAGLYFVGLLVQVNKAIPMPQSWVNTETDYAILTKSLLAMDDVFDLFTNLFIIALLPAICEELLFRGCIQNILIHHFGKHRHMLAIIITGIVFGLIHGQMQTVLPRIFLGIVLGLIYYYSNSIYTSILAHFFNNGLQIVLTYLVANHMLSTDVMDDNNIVPIGYGLLSGAVCIAKQDYSMQHVVEH
jgi:membrane protease YdiL (CAAX protease family)